MQLRVAQEALQMSDRDNAAAPSSSRAGGQLEGLPKSIMNTLTGPIAQEVMTDPVVLVETGITYERSAIEQWLACKHTCPVTNQPLTSCQLQPNILARQLLSDLGLPVAPLKPRPKGGNQKKVRAQSLRANRPTKLRPPHNLWTGCSMHCCDARHLLCGKLLHSWLAGV